MIVHALSANEFANRLLEHIVDPLIALMAFIALLYFIFSVIQVIRKSDSNDRPAMFKHLIWSVVGIFVIFSIWTVITFVGRLAESPITRNLETGNLEFGEYKLLRPRDDFNPDFNPRDI